MLELNVLIILIILMFLVSFLYSNLGLGGGMLYVPIMVLIAITMERLEIIPVSLFLSFMTQLPAAYTHYKKGFVKVKLGLLVGVATIPGIVFGVLLGVRVTDVLAYCMFSILMFITGTKMVYDLYKKKFNLEGSDKEYSMNRLGAVLLISVGTGMVAAFFGVGGGIIAVPVLLYILGLYPRRAIGTSALMIVVTSSIAFLCYTLLSLGSFDIAGITFRKVPPINFDLALILGGVVLIGAYLGSSWGLKSLKTKSIQIIFVIIIFIVGIQMLLKSLGYI